MIVVDDRMAASFEEISKSRKTTGRLRIAFGKSIKVRSFNDSQIARNTRVVLVPANTDYWDGL